MAFFYFGIDTNTPQAKGCVECANQTLQDRLVKWMRLRGINDLKAANADLPEYLAAHNRRFAKPPREPRDAHRPVQHTREELNVIFSLQHERQVSPNLEFQYQGRRYQIQGKRRHHALAGRPVVVCEGLAGRWWCARGWTGGSGCSVARRSSSGSTNWK